MRMPFTTARFISSNMMLPNGIGFVAHRVTKQRLVGADALIGMDIIGGGDFAVTNKDDKTVFSFRFPAAGHIDFEEDEKRGLPWRG